MREPLKGTSRQLSAMAQRGEAVKIMNGLYRPSLREQQTTWSRRGGGTRTFVTAAKAFVALPVLECIDSVSDVGGVDQAPQYVVVEVAESQGDAA